MPVQTQSRNQPVPTSDPFGDPNAIRVVPPLPPKVPPKRKTGMDNQKEAANTRNQDLHRAKPIRSQTQQNVGSVDHFSILRCDEYSLSLPPTLAMAVPKSLPVALCLKTPLQYHLSQKNPSPSAQARRAPPMRTLSIASIFQALAPVRPRSCLPRRLLKPQNLMTNLFPPVFHHDGPFDACAPSRNKHKIKAPMAAWSAQTNQAVEEDFKASKESPRYEPPRKKVDAIAEAWGIHEPEPFEDFSAGGGHSYDYRPHHTTHIRKSDEAPRRREAAPRRTALPPPQPIFVPGADAEFVAPEPSPPLSPGSGMKRSKSLLQRIRRMRENPNMPVNSGDNGGVQNTYESGGSGRPNHKSQNSFAGRLAGEGIKEQLPTPQEEDMYVPAEATKDKDLPDPPNTSRSNSGEKDYFEQTDEQLPATGLGRKRSLMQKVGGVVKGRK